MRAFTHRFFLTTSHYCHNNTTQQDTLLTFSLFPANALSKPVTGGALMLKIVLAVSKLIKLIN